MLKFKNILLLWVFWLGCLWIYWLWRSLYEMNIDKLTFSSPINDIKCSSDQCLAVKKWLLQCRKDADYCDKDKWDEYYEWELTNQWSLPKDSSYLEINWNRIMFQKWFRSKLVYFIRDSKWKRIDNVRYSDGDHEGAVYVRAIKSAKVFIKTKDIWDLEQITYIQEIEPNTDTNEYRNINWIEPIPLTWEVLKYFEENFKPIDFSDFD